MKGNILNKPSISKLKSGGYYPSIFTFTGIILLIFSVISPLFFADFKLPVFLSFILGFIIIFLGNIYLADNRKIIYEDINGLNKMLDSEYYRIDTIESILEKLELIYPKISGMYKYLEMIDLFYFDKDYNNQKSIIKDEVIFLIKNISNLRSDLSIRLAEQQKLLKSAKGEIEKNIGGTSELEQVSKLQKARLDKQIEQFEELQKVLVKV